MSEIIDIPQLRKLPTHDARVAAIFGNIVDEHRELSEWYSPEFHKIFKKFSRYYRGPTELSRRYYRMCTQSAVSAAPGKRCLDVGCGMGTQSLLLAASGAHQVIGLDINPVYIKLSHERAERWGADNITFVEDSITEYAPDELFDVIYVQEALHHIVPHELFFKQTRKLLKTNGKLIISEPNGGNPIIKWRLKKNGWNTGKLRPIGNGFYLTDEMYVPSQQVTEPLKANGFDIESLKRMRLFPNIKIPAVDKVLAAAEPVGERLVPLRTFGVGYVVTASKIS